MTTPSTATSIFLGIARMARFLVTDGGANDGKYVEQTGTSGGARNVAISAGSAKIGKVTDQTFTGVAEGQTTAGADAAVATSQTGAGNLLITNTDASVAAYLTFSGAAAANTKFLFQAGASINIPITDVTKVRCYSAGTPILSWAFFQVT